MNKNLEIFKNKYSNAEISKDSYLEFLQDMKKYKLETKLETCRNDNRIDNTELGILENVNELEILETLNRNTIILDNFKYILSNMP